MALARVQYEADGSTTEYSITFEYIERDHIKVSLDGDETSAWSFLDDSTIKFDSAPANGVIIDIVRQTEREVLLVEFNDGSTLLETDLTLAALQSFYLAQESFDQTGSTLTVANDGSYSASGRRISQLEYPNSSDDATNRQYVDDVFADGENAADMALEAQHWANYPEDDLVPEGDGVDDYSALHHRNKADDAQAASELARDEAQLWAEEDEDVEVETGAYSSKHHSIKSSDSASAAATSESNAATSESNAATSASNAATSESNAAGSETKAQLWAEEAEDVEVETGEYSAYHWSKKSEGWAAGVNMPSATGNGGQLIRQASDESGFEYITASEGRTLLDVYDTSTVYTKTEADGKYAQLAGGSDADFSSMPFVGGDYIVERGDNSNGTYVRFSNGVQLCFHRLIAEPREETTDQFTRDSDREWTFPASFIDDNVSGFVNGEPAYWNASSSADIGTEDNTGAISITAQSSSGGAVNETRLQYSYRYRTYRGQVVVHLHAYGFWK